MTDPDAPLSDAEALRRLDELRRRQVRLQERQRIAAHELARHERELARLQAEARAAYGTDDPDRLRALLVERRARNAAALLAFRDQLDAVERALAEIEAETRRAERADNDGL